MMTLSVKFYHIKNFMKKYNYLYPVLLLFFLFNSCSDPVTGNLGNMPPDTHLSLFPDSIISPGSTLRKIAWWGDDPDGFVVGFRFSFDSTKPVSDWSYTTKNDSTFILQMNGNDSTFRFYVSAVDDKGLADPTPASNLYPTINSAPSMQFNQATALPDSIFPVATVQFTATDPDGNATLRNFYWSLNDTNHFNPISGSSTVMTLTKDSGLVLNSNNSIYMRVQDNAGAYSKIVRMPSDSTKYFFVRKVNAKVLIIKDMPIQDMGIAMGYFNSSMDTVKYDTLDLRSGNGKFIPKIVNPMFIETLKLFNIVIWSSGRGNNTTDNANFDLAQRSLPFYTQYGGKVFFTTGFPNYTPTEGSMINFAPIDSISSCSTPFLSNVTFVNIDNTYPVLSTSILVQAVRGLKVNSSIPVIYRLPSTGSPCIDSSGGPVMMIKNVQNNPNIILMAVQVYFMNGNPSSSKALLRKIIVNEFGYN